MRAFPLLVATDLDGTIVRRDGTISERTVAAFARVEAAGARFVLVTGRPPRVMGSIAAAFGHRGTAICANGALTYDMRTETVEALHLIPPPALAAAAAALRAAVPGIGIAVEYPDGHAADATYQAVSWDVNSSIPRLDDAALFGRPASKLLGRHFGYTCDDLLALALPAARRPGQRHALQRQGARRGGRARCLQGHRGRRARGPLRDRAGIGDRVRRHAQRPAAAQPGPAPPAPSPTPIPRSCCRHPRHRQQRRGRRGRLPGEALSARWGRSARF